MARGGVTYLEVAKVAEKLRNKGIFATIDKVRAILETGSKTTIAHHLKRWKDSTIKDLEYETLPAELAKSVKNLHEQLQAQASQKIEELEIRSQKEIAQLLQQLKQEREQVGNLKRNSSELEADNNKLVTQIKNLEEKQEQLKQVNIKLTSEKNELDTKLQGKIEQITTLKEQVKSIERNSEHYLEMLKQQRDDERKQFAHHLNLLQQENNNLNTNIVMARKETAELKQEILNIKSKTQYFEELYNNKIEENNLLSNKLLATTSRQEKLLKNFLNTKIVAESKVVNINQT
jgi:chromosome segregation ATPase